MERTINYARKPGFLASLLLSLLTFSGVAKAQSDAEAAEINCASHQVQQNVLDALQQQLTNGYIFPKKAEQFAIHIKAQQAQKAFAKINDCDSFANIINEQLMKITDDKHLHVVYSPHPIPDETPESKAAFAAHEAEFMKSLNYGFEKVQRLPFNIGYINLLLFAETAQGGPQLASAMNLLSYTNALILDLRESRGGEPAMVDLITSYFMDERTNTSDIYYRKEDRLEKRFTVNQVSGKHYGQQRPVYILTSQDTFSAAEDLAYTLKHLNRAVIIGEVTGGGAHPGDMIKLTSHFESFIPNGRSINPITKTNWEGVGVQPNIKTAADKALNAAQQHILMKLKANETNLARADRMQKRIERLAL
ncbi:S41 family peptidase [Pseudoalteromonas piratica]|uniref:S41 family peptidase n=1 Tax=Pseudoalteromonas piratica TaxID=1348114 RepID=UPI0006921D05|nr:S41 family peptidase [Pseudoalteromonas piratica]